MELFCIEYANHKIRLVGSSWSGKESLFLNDELVAEQAGFSGSNTYQLELPGIGPVQLQFHVDTREGWVKVQLQQGNRTLLDQQQILRPPPQGNPAGAAKRSGHMWAWVGVGFKLLKSVKVIQVALVGMSLSAWSILYSWEFALAIVGILVFHEYGHLRAMKKCGIPTKGIYLIPFVGGVAVGDRARSHWQEVYVAMMGPFFGLAMTLLFGLGYYLTGNHFMGLVTSIGALVNLFNLLPILPLDGGRVFKAMALSGQHKAGLVTVSMLTVGGLALAFKLGLGLLVFFVLLGFADLMVSWREYRDDPLMGMDRYGIVFSLVWYLITTGAFVATILLMAETGLPGTELAARILED